MGKSDTHVFRISCELYEKVEPDILQSALEQTVETFKIYRSVLKRGLFWHYLESSDLMPVVHKEDRQPCATIYKKSGKNLLFDVSFFLNRVNLEVYHVLSDGTGAMNFFRTLITKYLALCHHLQEPSLDYDASATQMSDDSFRKYYTGSAGLKKSEKKTACRLSGRRYPENRLKIITGLCDIHPVLDAAHSYHTTLTVFLCACLMDAISDTVPVRAKKKPIVLSVPVDLRSHFPSASARNFFSILHVGYDFREQNSSFESVMKKVSIDFKNGLEKENLAHEIDAYSAVEHNAFARVAPLYLKDIALKAAYCHAMRQDTAGFSNVGIITMPPELAAFIRSFDICSATNRLQVCMCSFMGRLSISISAPFVSTEIQRHFFRTLAALGAEVEITSNQVGDGREEP